MSNDYPKGFARFYDTIYHQVRDGVDNDFHLNEIKQTFLNEDKYLGIEFFKSELNKRNLKCIIQKIDYFIFRHNFIKSE